MRSGTAIVLLVIMGALWGLQFAMLKLAAGSGYNDIVVLMIALMVLSVVFAALMAIRGERFFMNRQILFFLVVTAILGYVLPLLAALHAAAELSAGVLSLIACMSPVAATTCALVLRTEKVSPSRVVAVALGVASVCMILLPELDLPDQGKLASVLVALVVPLTYGIESVYISVKWPAGVSPLYLVTGETVVAAILVAPLLLIAGSPMPDAIDRDALIAIAVFATAGVVESLLYFYLIRATGGVLVNFGTFVSLFAGIAWGIVLFSESHLSQVWLAAVTLVAALWLARRGHPPSNP
ncbi:MAG: DMT family transporter [Rhodospirillales bacterium]